MSLQLNIAHKKGEFMKANNLNDLLLILIFFLAGCGPQNCPDCYVVVPTGDSTPPEMVTMDVYDPDVISFNATSQPTTIIAVSDVVSIIASARDSDGGIQATELWATYTYYKPGQISGPGLATIPVTASTSTVNVGESTLKSRTVAYNLELKKELGGWSRIKVDVWIEGKNFYGGLVKTPTISITYPTRQDGDTDYMAYCRRQRVPIPPDWAESGTAWVLQGNLRTGTNLLQPGQDAFVWTYTDPVRRGACIALPRGGAGQAGMICQSATTGNACFWDNKLRDDGPNAPILDWRGGTQLIISQLQDGSNLQENCTGCHRGNNVFLISPDDPTWTQVLSGPLSTSPGSTFTTKLERSSDMQGDHARYIPVTYPASRPNWINPYQTGGCAGACHEIPPVEPGFGFNTPSPMPPACAVGGTVEECYR
jgi:hypothetical protein